MQPESTPEPNLFQLSGRALGKKPTTEEVTGFTALLCAQQLFVRGTRDPADPDALHLGILDLEDGDEPFLYLATSRDLADSLPGDLDDEGNELISITGEVLLGFAAQRRNNVVIITSDSDDENIIIPHGSLELLAKLAVLTGDRATQNRPSDEAIRAAYPTAFAGWLHEYCRAHSDIREARLALARLGNSSQPDVVVGLEAGAAYSHMDRISVESRHLLKPAQVFYTEDQITGMGQGGSFAEDLRRHPPLYRKEQPTGMVEPTDSEAQAGAIGVHRRGTAR